MSSRPEKQPADDRPRATRLLVLLSAAHPVIKRTTRVSNTRSSRSENPRSGAPVGHRRDEGRSSSGVDPLRVSHIREPPDVGACDLIDVCPEPIRGLIQTKPGHRREARPEEVLVTSSSSGWAFMFAAGRSPSNNPARLTAPEPASSFSHHVIVRSRSLRNRPAPVWRVTPGIVTLCR